MTNNHPSNSIVLARLEEQDVSRIRKWPPYPSVVFDLDYGIRLGGWLDQFPESASTRRFAAWHGKELVGFSILTDISDGSAEFYIAVHPERLAKGYGRALTRETIRLGFERLGLRRIYLKVRDWHKIAIATYESEGFKTTGSCVADIQGRPVSFITMEVNRNLKTVIPVKDRPHEH